jgi:hypothetical protein
MKPAKEFNQIEGKRFGVNAGRRASRVVVCAAFLFLFATASSWGQGRPVLQHKTNQIEGWTVLVDPRLIDSELPATDKALGLLRVQLQEIVRKVPAEAVAELRKVTLWFSPEYSGVQPRAEYHPGAGWLRDNGRNPAMAKGVEFTDVRNFESESKRMPNFTLHELAHAYHDRVLPGGFDNAEITAAYEAAKAGKSYDRVERWFGNGRPNTFERAYAMTNPQEYFAESTEAFFSRNDFFPFTRAELKRHDPEMFALLAKLWKAPTQRAVNHRLKVFILAGQSNMEGHARVGTFDYLGDDPATAPLLGKMRNPDGTPHVCDHVWISYLTGIGENNGEGFGRLTTGYGSREDPKKDGGKIGPEFTFGLTMEGEFKDPVLLIKTAWGGKSLFYDFRPPSAGPYPRTPQDIEKGRNGEAGSGLYYRLMIEHVKKVLGDIKRVCPDYDPEQGYEVAGFVWFQGFNDMVDRDVYPPLPKDSHANRFAKYSEWMADFIRDARMDLGAPQLPFVIGVMGVDGAKAAADNLQFREAMAAPASLTEFRGNVAAVATAPFWDEPLGAIQEKYEQVRQMEYLLRTKNKNAANKDGTMTEADQKAWLEKFEADLVSPAEVALRQRGASNAGYHYLGCAKTFARIGEAFAEAILEMRTAAPVPDRQTK